MTFSYFEKPMIGTDVGVAGLDPCQGAILVRSHAPGKVCCVDAQRAATRLGSRSDVPGIMSEKPATRRIDPIGANTVRFWWSVMLFRGAASISTICAEIL